jgi:hypothetical protein
MQLSPPIWKWFTATGGEEQEAAREAAVVQLHILEVELALRGNEEFFARESVGLFDLLLAALTYLITICRRRSSA